MVSNNAAEFSSGFRLRVISVLGSDECAPRIARSTSSGARLLRTVVLLSLRFKRCSVVLSHQSVQYCLALPFLPALGVGVDDWIKANEVGLQLWSSTDALVLPWAITDALVRADLHYSSGFS